MFNHKKSLCNYVLFHFTKLIIRPLVIVILFSCLFSGGCSNEPSPSENRKGKTSLKLVGEYTLPLDDSTGFMATSLQYLAKDNTGQSLLILQYKKDNKVIVYDPESKAFQNKIVFEEEGPNGVGSSLNGVLWISSEEIYLYSYWERRIYKVNEKAQVLKMVQFDDKNVMLPVLEPKTLRPILKIGNNILLTGYLFTTLPKGKIGKPFIEVNLDNDSFSLLGEYPEKIFSGAWSIKAQTYYDYIPEDSLFVISFAISDSVFVTDFKHHNNKFLASSPLVGDVQPISPDYNFQGGDKVKGYTYDLSPEYYGIKYDPFRRIYYRFGVVGRSLKEFSSGILPTFFVIILNEKMSKIGQHVFEKGEYPSMCFITEKGLYIANKNKYLENEDSLIFNIYLPNQY